MVAATLEEVEGPWEFGLDAEASVAAAFAAGGLPKYLDKHTVDLWPAFPQWWHTSLSWFPSFLLCSFDLQPKHLPCNGLAPFVRLGPLRSLKLTKYQHQTQRRQC